MLTVGDRGLEEVVLDEKGDVDRGLVKFRLPKNRHERKCTRSILERDSSKSVTVTKQSSERSRHTSEILNPFNLLPDFPLGSSLLSFVASDPLLGFTVVVLPLDDDGLLGKLT